MNQPEALRRLNALGVTSFETRDAAALLGISPANASLLLGRLSRRDLIGRIGRGRWTLGQVSPGMLVEQVAAPYPAYISLHSALFRHGLIEQVPAVTFAVTLGRARRIQTPHGTVSLHRIPPELFDGFVTSAEEGGPIATAEKALFDLIYLGPTRSRLFAKLPELEITRDFDWMKTKRWTKRIAGPNRRSFVENKLTELRGYLTQRRTSG